MTHIYPSLEDLKFDEAARMQQNFDREMALDLQEKELMVAGYGDATENQNQLISAVHNLDLVSPPKYEPPTYHRSSYLPGMVAPVSNYGMLGMKRAEIRPGIRSIFLCKDEFGKLGIRIKSICKGIFVSFVQHGSPASLGGLRFGDQILQINNETVAGYSGDKVMKILNCADPTKIEMAIRDRPFERIITLQKDNVGRVGLVYKRGKVVALVKNSSAARNGLLIDHYICEINGQCVVGLKDQEIEEVMLNCGPTVTITLMTKQIYERITKGTSSGLWKKQDHTIPDL